MDIPILKADGTSEPFIPEKLAASLQKAGAAKNTAEEITREIRKELRESHFGSGVVTTEQICRHAFVHLRRTKRAAAARYSLKRAVLEFGPTGFPFEAYIAELFRAEGYEAQVDQMVRGRCVEHEVDVVRKKGEEITYVEAKFHNVLGFKTDLKVVLYVQARIEDINKGKGLVATNTKFTGKAIEYATCAGLELLGWDYPQGKTLHERIDAARLYPVTALTSLSRREKTALLRERVVLCNALPHQAGALARAGVGGHRADVVLEEVGALCLPKGDIY